MTGETTKGPKGGDPRPGPREAPLRTAIQLMEQRGAARYFRSDGATVYEHSWGVALIAHDLFGITDDAVIAAALLHDAVEKSLATQGYIGECCGEETSRLVEVLTRRQEEGLGGYTERIEGAGEVAVQLKICDRIEGLRRAHKRGAESRARFIEATWRWYLPLAQRHCLRAAAVMEDEVRRAEHYSS